MALHLGLRGTLARRIDWYTKFSYSDNAGTYDAPITPSAKQFSGLLALQSRIALLGGSTVKGSLMIDSGDLYPKNYGFTLGLRKNFSL